MSYVCICACARVRGYACARVQYTHAHLVCECVCVWVCLCIPARPGYRQYEWGGFPVWRLIRAPVYIDIHVSPIWYTCCDIYVHEQKNVYVRKSIYTSMYMSTYVGREMCTYVDYTCLARIYIRVVCTLDVCTLDMCTRQVYSTCVLDKCITLGLHDHSEFRNYPDAYLSKPTNHLVWVRRVG